MVLFAEKIVLWIVAAVAAYVIYKMFFFQKGASLSSYEREIEDILTSDKCRVKGKFEE
ncbi:hypothetical protein HYU17_03850 [Candidatus Woesearchaeota archaeon]|nr:hypothetical protein [Candidatus Woesearchaeota archaeon]